MVEEYLVLLYFDYVLLTAGKMGVFFFSGTLSEGLFDTYVFFFISDWGVYSFKTLSNCF